MLDMMMMDADFMKFMEEFEEGFEEEVEQVRVRATTGKGVVGGTHRE